MVKPSKFLVNFLIVGAQKCGTTALASFLAKHPEIYITPVKESHYFDAEDFDNDSWVIRTRYHEMFRNRGGEKLVGEATPSYMYLEPVAERIYRYNPEMKLIFLLRDPVHRAISHYKMQAERDLEWLPFELALRAEPCRLWRDRNNYSFRSSLRIHSYVRRGFYSEQIARMLGCFKSSQMLFIRTDDLRNAHGDVLKRIYQFLGVRNHDWVPEQRFLFLGDGEGQVSAYAIKRLRRKYHREIARLEELLSWNLEHWKQVRPT